MYNIKIIYVYKILCSKQDMYTITAVFDIDVQKFVCILFCRVISQQHGGSGDLRYKVFVIAILHHHNFMHHRCLRK